MTTTYKQPGKIKISFEMKEDLLDLLDTTLHDIANDNYTEPKLSTEDSHYENILDLNDLYREIQGADYLIELLQKIKVERAKQADKLLKRINKK
jgi:hypothetical protein